MTYATHAPFVIHMYCKENYYSKPNYKKVTIKRWMYFNRTHSETRLAAVAVREKQRNLFKDFYGDL